MTAPLPAKVVPLRPDDASLGARDDDALMLLASGGHRGAFRVLVSRHATRVFRFCVRMTNDPRTAEEIAQDVWLHVWDARETYAPNGRFVVWLLVMAKNRCLNVRRGDTRRARVLVAEPEDGLDANAAREPTQVDRLIALEQQRRVYEALDELPHAMREAMTLRYAEGLAYEQIAEVVGASASTVRSRVFHAVRRLHELLSTASSSSKTSVATGAER